MNRDEHIEQQARDALEQRAAALDGATLSRLRQARAHAVEHGLRRRRRWLTLGLPAAGALAAATLVAFNVWHAQPQPGYTAPDPALLENLALEASAPPVDPDFYEWLAGNGNGAA